MRALVLDGAPRLDRAFPDPERKPGEAIVDVLVAGVCDTDLQLARGYMGFRGVPGHEFVGRVRESDDPRWIGKRVVADINAGCGACDECRERAGHHCGARTVLGILARSGAFADRLSIPERCLVEVPDDVSDDRAVFAEPLAAALHVLDDASWLEASDRAVVLGDGKLGQLIARALAGVGHRVVMVGRHERKLAMIRSAGVEALLEGQTGLLPRSRLVVDATGSASGLALAMKLTAPRGTIVLKTTVAGALEIDLSPLVIDEIRLVGSRCGDMHRAVDVLTRRQVDPLPLVEARYPLDEAADAIAHAGRKGSMKVLVDV
ncbi:MAG: alcohol dehydrogenase catalytic domain-containing protein [Polyangiaceae bacterium]|nr:alcohol dehydrogenase catalytic domain-containing protein [Polyangiaceae bacterium]